MKRSRRWLFVSTVVACCFGLAGGNPTARADSATRARFFDERARRAYAAGRFQQALREFLSASNAATSDRALYNIGLCADAAGEFELAYEYLTRYLEGTDDDAERRRDATTRRDRLASKLALVEVVSRPAGATILLDRVELGEFGNTPQTLALDPGQHTIYLRHPDYHEVSTRIHVVRGQVARVELPLEPRLGKLRLTKDPAFANVTIRHAASETWAQFQGSEMELPVGKYRLRLEARGYAVVTADTVVHEAKETLTTLAAPALPPKVGDLLIGTGTVNARVFVDGRLKAVTPVRLEQIPAGEHRVELRAAQHQSWSGKVRVRDGDTTFLNVSLRRQKPR